MGEVVVALLLALPVAPPTPPTPPKVPAPNAARGATPLQRFFIDREVMGVGECENWLNPDNPAIFWSDFAVIVARRARVQHYPPLADAVLFPGPAEANRATALNDAHRAWLDARLDWELDRQGETRAWLAENARLRQVWSRVAAAGCAAYGVEWRREALNGLRQDLGAEAYYRGELPPPVPVWRFAEVPCGSHASAVGPRKP